eukprot:scaffold15682_cov131-Isochrysis_galbana.AAC.8
MQKRHERTSTICAPCCRPFLQVAAPLPPCPQPPALPAIRPCPLPSSQTSDTRHSSANRASDGNGRRGCKSAHNSAFRGRPMARRAKQSRPAPANSACAGSDSSCGSSRIVLRVSMSSKAPAVAGSAPTAAGASRTSLGPHTRAGRRRPTAEREAASGVPGRWHERRSRRGCGAPGWRTHSTAEGGRGMAALGSRDHTRAIADASAVLAPLAGRRLGGRRARSPAQRLYSQTYVLSGIAGVPQTEPTGEFDRALSECEPKGTENRLLPSIRACASVASKRACSASPRRSGCTSPRQSPSTAAMSNESPHVLRSPAHTAQCGPPPVASPWL